MSDQPAVIIASDYFRGHHYGPNHPLGIPRVPLTLDLIGTYGPLPPKAYVEARKATFEELTEFHDPTYIAALQACQSAGRVKAEYRQRFNIGNFENPYFSNFYDIPSLAAGGSLQAAEHVVGGQMAFNPAGGMHHAAPERARGFCFLNDCVLAIARLRREGWKVLYFDMDAHHGDGVQHAFENDRDVLTVSFHMDTSYAYPRRGGQLSDVGVNGTALNFPLPQSTNDSEYRCVFKSLWPDIIRRFQPDAVVLQTGTDILSHDPLGKLDISNRLFLEVVDGVKASAPRDAKGNPRLAVLGGGGYHPIALARCWTGVWHILVDEKIPATLPRKAQRLLNQVDWKEDAGHGHDANLMRNRIDASLEGKVRSVIHQRIAHLLKAHPLFAI